VRTIFAQPDQGAARKQLGQVAATLAEKLPRAAELLLEAEEDVLATWPSRPVTGGRRGAPVLQLGVHGDPVRGSRDGAGVACAYRGREGDGRLARQGQRGTPIYTLDGT